MKIHHLQTAKSSPKNSKSQKLRGAQRRFANRPNLLPGISPETSRCYKPYWHTSRRFGWPQWSRSYTSPAVHSPHWLHCRCHARWANQSSRWVEPLHGLIDHHQSRHHASSWTCKNDWHHCNKCRLAIRYLQMHETILHVIKYKSAQNMLGPDFTQRKYYILFAPKWGCLNFYWPNRLNHEIDFPSLITVPSPSSS